MLTCKKCGHESATFNPFSILPVPLPEKNTKHQQLVRLHYGGNGDMKRKPMDLAVPLSTADMKTFTIRTLLSKLYDMLEGKESSSSSRSDIRINSVVIEYSNSGTYINSVLEDESIRLRTNDLRRPIDVCYFDDDDDDDKQEKKEKDDEGQEREKKFNVFQEKEKVQINIRGIRVLYPGAWVLAKYRGNGKYYPAKLEEVRDNHSDNDATVSWIDNDSKYRDVKLEHIETKSENAKIDVWIDANIVRKEKKVVEEDEKTSESYKVNILATLATKSKPVEMIVPQIRIRRPIPKTCLIQVVQRRDKIPFSSPIILRVRSISGKDLYEIILRKLRSRYIPDWDPNMVNVKYPFKLRFVQKNGRGCRKCEWIRACNGCEEISCEDESEISFSFSSPYDTIAIDWNNSIFSCEGYNMTYGEEVMTHDSMKHFFTSSRKEEGVKDTPDQIEHCLRTFVKPEEIKTYCKRCTKHDSESDFVETKKTKTISLWGLPPLLIFQLKRFKTVRRGRRRQYSYKLNNLIDFPIDCLDLKTFLAEEMHVDSEEEKDEDEEEERKRKIKKAETKPLSESELRKRRRLKMLGEQTKILLKNQPETLSRNCKGIPLHLQHLSSSSSSRQFLLSPRTHVYSLSLSLFLFPSGTQYELFAVCNHRGAIGGGHYYTYAKSSVDGKWRVYNDTKVYEIESIKHIVTRNAYLLFYQRKDLIGKPVESLFPDSPAEITRLNRKVEVEAFKSATWDKPKEMEEGSSSFFGGSGWSPFALDENATCVVS